MGDSVLRFDARQERSPLRRVSGQRIMNVMDTYLVVWSGGCVEFFCRFRAAAFAAIKGGVVS